MNTKHILAIDYGTKNIGLASTESDIPEPLPGLRVSDLQDASRQLTSTISSLNPDLVLIGMPEGQLAPVVDKLIQLLQENTTTPILSHPETLSTQEAISKLRASGAKRKKLRHDHSYAACLILEDYLELQPSS